MVTIEQFLRNKLQGFELSIEALEVAAQSPQEVGMDGFELSDPAYPIPVDPIYVRRRVYAESTIYYMIANLVGGGGVTEKIGDVSYSNSGHTIAQEDRMRFLARANNIRSDYGFPVEGEISEIKNGAIYKDLIR